MRIDYVALAYAVFGLVLGWDLIVPRVRLASVRKAIRRRAQRDATRQGKR